MVEEGVFIMVSIDGLLIFGFFDGFKVYGCIKERVVEVVVDILSYKFQVVVLIDSWGFMLWVVQGVCVEDFLIKLIKYVGFQVFVMCFGWVKILVGVVDYLMIILSFDVCYYELYGLFVIFVGNLMFDCIELGDGVGFCFCYGIVSDVQMFLVLFGSCKLEIDCVGLVFMDMLK